jgi:predicted esterase
MQCPRRLITLSLLALLICTARAEAQQITASDLLFFRLSTATNQMAYEQRGGDMKPIAPLIAEANKSAAIDPLKAYRAYTQALVLLSGAAWTPEAELATALDFTINAKAFAPGDYVQARATFIFDAPAAAESPYRLELEVLKADGSREALINPGVILGDVRSRRGGEFIGFAFDPSKLAGPGLHTLRATLKNGKGAELYQYYRTFFVINALGKRVALIEKSVEALPDQNNPGATTLRYVAEATRQAQTGYLGGPFQNLIGYLHTGYRARGLSASEVMDFDAELTRATKLAENLKTNRNAVASLRGDLRLAYRSSFDGKLVPYRIYVPSNYDNSKKYPFIMLLHGAGGDENNFLDRYEQMWPKLAEERGYIIAAANGRGPVSGYAKENGAEQDVMDVIALVEKNYSIDPAREYLAGHSMGAAGTWRLGFEFRSRFAALAPIAGTRPSPAIDAALASGRKVPMIVVCGVKDALVPVAGCRQVADKLKAAGYDSKYLEYPDGDHLSVASTSIKDIFEWFDAHRKETP